jgi:hypothetical protein
VVFDQLSEQTLEVATVARGEWREQRLLSGLDLLVEALQRAGASRAQFNQEAPPVVRIANPRELPALLKVVQQGVHFAAVDEKTPTKRGLACGPPFS